MTKDIKDNIFASTIANGGMSQAAKIDILAAVLNNPRSLIPFKEFTDHLMVQHKQIAQELIDLTNAGTFSLWRDFVDGLSRDFAKVARSSSKLLAAFAREEEIFDKLISTNNDMLDTYRILSAALLRTDNSSELREIEKITKQFEQQSIILNSLKEGVNEQISGVFVLATGATKRPDAKVQAPKNQI